MRNRVTALAVAALVMVAALVSIVLPLLTSASATSATLVAGPYDASVIGAFGLVSFWPEQETSGSTAADSYGTNSGSYENSPVLGAIGRAGDTPPSGAAFDYHGSEVPTVNPYVDVPSSTSGLAPPGSFSIEGWIDNQNCQNSVYSDCRLFNDEQTVNGTGEGFALGEGAGATGDSGGPDENHYFFDVAGSVYGRLVGPAYTAGWHFVVATYSEFLYTAKLYVDGVLVASRSEDSGYTPALSSDLFLDGDPGGHAIEGETSELALYAAALTQSEIAGQYDAAESGPPPAPPITTPPITTPPITTPPITTPPMTTPPMTTPPMTTPPMTTPPTTAASTTTTPTIVPTIPPTTTPSPPTSTATTTPSTTPSTLPTTGLFPTPAALDATYPSVNFDDEFSGTTLSSHWETCVWYDPCHTPGDISDNNGGVADAANVSVNNGLTLTATSSTPTIAQSWGDGWIDSGPSYQTPVGGGYYVEIKAKMPPAAPGLWPALVLYEDGDKVPSDQYAEIDILERISQPQSNGTIDAPTAYQSWHPASGNGAANEIGGIGVDLTGWNTYGVSVDRSGNIQFWFDGKANGPPIAGGANALEGMFLNAVMSTGGSPNDGWAGVPSGATPSPSSMNIAYIRVFS